MSLCHSSRNSACCSRFTIKQMDIEDDEEELGVDEDNEVL